MSNEGEVLDLQLVGCSSGLGCRFVLRSDLPVINLVREGGVAERYGVQVDDVIDKVNGKVVTGMSADDLVKLIRGAGDTVDLTIRRGVATVAAGKTADLPPSDLKTVDFANKSGKLKMSFLPVDGKIIITEVLPNGLAASEGISKFDEIYSVGSRCVRNLSSDEVVDIIHQQRNNLKVSVRPFHPSTTQNYRPPLSIPQPDRDFDDGTYRDVEVDNKKIGDIGMSFVPRGVYGKIVIHQVFESMQAQALGLQPSEEIACVNGTCVSGWPAENVLDFIRHAGDKITLKIREANQNVVAKPGSRAFLESNMYRYVRMHNCHNPNGIGLSFVVKERSGRVIIVDVEAGSLAEQAGLEKKEEIVELSGVTVTGMNKYDVEKLFKASDSITLRVKCRQDLEAWSTAV
eukprot:Rmarinus@m.4255